MDKELLQFLVSYLSATLNMDEAGVAALFDADGKVKPDSLKLLKDKDVERVTALTTEKFDEGHKKATKEARSTFENELKQKFGISSKKVGVELVEEIVSAKAGKPGELTEEQVKNSKYYLDLKEQQDKAIEEAVKAKEEEFTNFKKQVERKDVIGKVTSVAEAILDGMKPILSSDPVKAKNQKRFFLKQIEEGNYRLDGDRIIMLDETGKDKLDGHNKRVDFETFAKETASGIYDFAQADQRSGAGGAGAGAAGASTVKVPKTKDEYSKLMSQAKDSKERADLTKAWTESEAFKQESN